MADDDKQDEQQPAFSDEGATGLQRQLAGMLGADDEKGPQRSTELSIDISGEQLRLVRLEAHEALCQPFFITIDVLSTLGAFDLLPHLGKPALIESRNDGDHQRYFHGLITDGYILGEASSGPDDGGEGTFLYRLTLQPTAYFVSHGRDFRIFQEMKVIDIIKDVLKRRNIDHEVKLASDTSGNRVLEYCVQYGENDIAFVTRLMEEHGLYYFYRHDEAGHVMVIGDNVGAHVDVPKPDLTYAPYTQGETVMARRRISAWQEHLSTGAEVLATYRDYTPLKPEAPREVKAQASGQHQNDVVEVYHWPGRFAEDDEGNKLAEHALGARRAQRQRYDGSSDYTALQVGYTFKLKDHPVERFNQSYLVTSAFTSLAIETYRSSEGGDSTEVRIGAIPAATRFIAPQLTPRAVVRGPETAVVVGPAGEEIYVDEYGRIKVQFFWDRLGKHDDKSSCWIRVSQMGGLGHITIPRIGHEVLVDFINGDPDRPIVVGALFNKANMPHYELPAHKTRAVIRSQSYRASETQPPQDAKGLADQREMTSHHNEIRLEDKTSAEHFAINASRDMTVTVFQHSNIAVGGSETTAIGMNRTETVGANETINIGQDRAETVARDETITVGRNRTESVGKNETVSVAEDRSVSIGKTETLTVAKAMTISCDDEISITAAKKITITVGSSKITIDPTSIKIKTVQFEAKADATIKLKSAMGSMESDAISVVKGALVKVN